MACFMMNTTCSILLSSLLLLLAALAGTDASPPGPRIELLETNHDFGRVMTGQKLEHHFHFTNTGNATLEISAVHTTCGCTTEGGWTRRVEPSKEGWIAVQFDSARMEGPVAKSLTVVCNDPRQTNIALSFKALVWKPIEVCPALACFNVVGDLESNRVQTLRITNRMTAPLELSEPRCTSANFQTTLKTLEVHKIFKLAITAIALSLARMCMELLPSKRRARTCR
jgi:hypothetical protein